MSDRHLSFQKFLAAVGADRIAGRAPHDLCGLTYDSRRVREGYAFFALTGQHNNGVTYAAEAEQRGAAIIVFDEGSAVVPSGSARRPLWVPVPSARLALADAATCFYGEPSSKMQTVGITGTNGKTTSSFMLRAILECAGRAPGLVGTIQYAFGGRCLPAVRTTPESSDLQDLLAQMVDSGCDSALLEVSSHSLAQERVRGTTFDVVAFTNLTPDHLDYHRTMENYFDAKQRLFSDVSLLKEGAAAVVNIDDAWGRKLPELTASARVVTFGIDAAADVRASNIRPGAGGSSFSCSSPWGDFTVELKLPGHVNVSNALLAIACSGSMGIDVETMAKGLSGLTAVPGRMEVVPNQLGLHVYVDYAHTEDALANALRIVRGMAGEARVLVVFGCGGDRDKAKRPAMGRVAEELADVVVLTNDNPRSEDPAVIMSEIRSGMKDGAAAHMVPDRREAIAHALQLAGTGDTVLIAGKGHERVQEIARTRSPFDDREVAAEALAALA